MTIELTEEERMALLETIGSMLGAPGTVTDTEAHLARLRAVRAKLANAPQQPSTSQNNKGTST